MTPSASEPWSAGERREPAKDWRTRHGGPGTRARPRFLLAKSGAAYEATGQRSARPALAHDHLAAHDGRHIALGSLQESPRAGRQVECHLRQPQSESAEIDHVEVGLETRADDAAVVETVERRRVARERSDGRLERDPRSAPPVPHPV